MFTSYGRYIGHACFLLAAIVVGVMVWNAAVLDTQPVSAQLEVIPSRVYPGEMPIVRITLKGPSTGTATALKVEEVYFGITTDAFHLDLLTEEGKRVGGGPPDFYGGNLSQKHYSWLAFGYARVSQFESHYRPTRPGKYTMKAKIVPDVNKRFKLELNAPLTCVEIEEKAVLSNVSLEAVRQRSSGPRGLKLQVMNVKDEDRYDLVYTSTDGDGTMCWRLLALDEHSKVKALVKKQADESQDTEIWIEYDKGGKLHFLRIGLLGRILEQCVIRESRIK